jgi:formylglycine-generating enzyme
MKQPRLIVRPLIGLLCVGATAAVAPACSDAFESCSETRTCAARDGTSSPEAGAESGGNAQGGSPSGDAGQTSGGSDVAGSGTTAGAGAGAAAGEGGIGGRAMVPCDGKCMSPTPVCDEATDTCVNQTCVAGQFQCAADGLGRQPCNATTGEWDTPVPCVNQACPAGKTACEGMCTPGTKQCSGNGVQTCNDLGRYSAAEPCGAGTPYCNGAGVCVPRSCSGLPATCGGSSGNASCCTSAVVPGGVMPFNRSNNPAYPAIVSDFRLDTYEVTVGRFRKFVEVYTPDMIQPEAGKNPNNAADPGWSTSWNANLPIDKAALREAVKCIDSYETWTDVPGGNENRPINCVNWYEAYAFCIWDGGRLPTELEWNFAAAAGTQQLPYPWGSTAPGANANLAVYGCHYPTAGGSCTGVTNIAPVGSAPAGNAKSWGHADLVGNVLEWNVDWNGSYPLQCNNCANFATSVDRVISGGAFHGSATLLLSSFRNNGEPAYHFYGTGVRCARSP